MRKKNRAMQKASTALLFLLSFIASLSAQDYKKFYHQIYIGDKLSSEGNYSEALSQYEAASEEVDFVSTTHLQKFYKVAKKG